MSKLEVKFQPGDHAFYWKLPALHRIFDEDPLIVEVVITNISCANKEDITYDARDIDGHFSLTDRSADSLYTTREEAEKVREEISGMWSVKREQSAFNYFKDALRNLRETRDRLKKVSLIAYNDILRDKTYAFLGDLAQEWKDQQC